MFFQLKKKSQYLLLTGILIVNSFYVNAQETCQIYGQPSVCTNTLTYFYSGCSGDTFSWMVNSVIVGNESMLGYTFDLPGTYLVTLYYSTMGGPGGPGGPIEIQSQSVPLSSGSVSMSVTVLASPEVPIIQPSTVSICNSGSVILSVTNTAPGITYTWHSIPSGYSGTGTTQTFNNVSTSREFYVTANNGSCTSQSSRIINVVTTEITPQLDLTISYRKRIIRGSAYGYDHYWQRTATGTEIIQTVTGDYTVTQEGPYYIRRRSLGGNCWTTATDPINVTVGLIPPPPVILQVKKAGYNEFIYTESDKQHVLTYADYYWVKDNTSNPEVINGYIVDNQIVQGKIYQNGTYYLKGRDRATGTWGSTLTLNVTLRGDNGLNWVHTKAYDGSQVPLTVSESKSYFDESGKPLQSQSKSMESGHVFATQNVKDKYDRVVGSTMPAPIQGNDFRYNADFFLAEDNKQYSPDNFDTPEKKYNPDVAGSTTPGTVGWYYSENNTLEPNVGKTNYPYSRTEFYEDGTGEVKRAGAPGNYHRLGMGHEPLTGTFPIHNELDDYYVRKSIDRMQFANPYFVNRTMTPWVNFNPFGDSRPDFVWSGESTVSTSSSLPGNKPSTSLLGQQRYGGLKWPKGTYVIKLYAVNYSMGGVAPFISNLKVYASDSPSTTVSDITYNGDGNVEVGVVQREIIVSFVLHQDYNYLLFSFDKLGQSTGYNARISLHGIEIISVDNVLQLVDRESSKGVQTVSRDANGKYGISITNKEGKTVMTAREGKSDDVEHVLGVQNIVSVSANESSHLYRKMLYFYILENQPVNIHMPYKELYGLYNSSIIKDSYDPLENIYIASEEIRLKPGFSVTAGQTLHGRIESTGVGWSVENLVTGERLPVYGTFADASGKWPAGFYRILMHSGEINVSYTNYFQDVSYQFYDAAGRLKTSVSPNGFKKWTENSNPAVNFPSIDKTTYQYNARGWLLSMTEPDAGTTTYKYRKDGKIRFSQNAQQADDGRFSYTHYDRLGRPVESGEYKGTEYTFTSVVSELESLRQDLFSIEDEDVKDWIKTFYDFQDPNPEHNLPAEFVQEFLRGAVSYTENENMKTWYSYDELGRVVWMAQKPKVFNRTFVSVYTYDFLGNVLTAGNLSYEPGNLKDRFYHHYEYDKDKRLSKAFTSLDGGEDKKLRAVYKYYLHGPLKRVELGGGVQGIDFVYNIHGWLTQINHPSLDATKDPGRDGAPESSFRKDAFGMAIDYYESEMEGLFPVAMNTPQHKAPELFHNLPGTREKGNSQHKETEERLAWMDIQPVVKNTQDSWVSQVNQINDYLAINQPTHTAPNSSNKNTTEIDESDLSLHVAVDEFADIVWADLTVDASTLTVSVNNHPGLIVAKQSPLGLIDDALEFAALKALYDSLDGTNWANKTGWPTAGNWPASATPAQMATWRGITVSNGDIIGISLGTNRLAGKIPAAIQDLKALKTLTLNNNSITGQIPTWLGSMTNLETLYLYTNQLTGGIPSSLGNLSALKTLGLQSNPLGGAIPASLGSLTNLQVLLLHATQLTGNIPSSISGLVNLRQLNLSTNPLITGSIPDLSLLTELEQLNLYSLTGIDAGSLPSWLEQLSKLTALSFENSKRTGTIPVWLGNLSNLKTLNLASNQLSGNIPAELGNLSDLENLYLQGNELSGTIPNEIGGLIKLKILYAHTNQLIGSLPPSLYTLVDLTNLQIYRNQFTGIISPEIGNLSKLVTLDISINNFSGNIPASIGNLTLMQNLILTSNQFTGTLPLGIVNMPNLKLLYVANNQLEGEIPDLGGLVNIQNIALQNNRFTGSIGSWIGNLVKMLTFRIDNNKFTEVHSNILQLPLLTNVYFTNNQLTSIPDFYTYSNKANLNLYIANNYFDFGDLEPLFGSGTHGIRIFTYSPQKKPVLPAKVHIPAGNVLEIKAEQKGNFSTVTWEKQNGSSWLSMNSFNEDNTQQNYRISNATSSVNGTYRWRMTSTRVTGLTLESTPVEITVVDALSNPNQPGGGALFNGIISSVRWSTQTPVGSEEDGELTGMYQYTYDDKYQVKEANWAEPNYLLNTFSYADNKYRVTNLNYDPNGNIKNLTRYDKDALRTDNFTYAYEANKNKLTSVSGYTSNYTYNAIGQMTGADKVSGDDQYIEYDVSGKVRKVFKDAAKTQLATEYLYDDRGFRLVKITPTGSGSEVRSTWYIRDASGNVTSIYEQDGRPELINTNPFTQTEVPVYGAGKLGTYYASQDGSVVYELTDHLGNVRALVREDVNVYTATMEDNGQNDLTNPRVQELQFFENLFETEQVDANANHTPGGSRSAYLNWTAGSATAHKAIGPAIMLKVNAGDTIRAEVWAKFKNKPSFNRNLGLVAMSQLLGGSFAYTGVFETYTFNQTATAFNDALLSAGFGGTGTDEERPFAYLNYILFNDDDMASEDAGWARVPESAGYDLNQVVPHARVTFEQPIVATRSGYVYIWVSNESEGAEVWFDDLKVTHTQTVVTQATDYGVWGDVLREMKAAEITYRHGYQGQFAEKDDETGWNHFELREYDPVIGRWTSKDPYGQYWSPYVGMGNNPVSGVDPNGGISFDYFRDELGAIVFRNSSEATLCENGQILTNIGTAYASFDGNSLDLHYQVKDECGDLIAKTFSTPAISGRPNDKGLFNYTFQNQKNVGSGPLPEGNYTISITDLREMTLHDDVIGKGLSFTQLLGKKYGSFPGGIDSWGFGRIPIEPKSVVIDGVTRTGFTIHGGNDAGSAGCIDLMRGETLFFSKMKQHTNGPIILQARYEKTMVIISPFNSTGTGFK